MLIPALAAVAASFGWATGIVLAQAPARAVGAFEFTRIQLIACAALMGLICTGLGHWQTVTWAYWPAFLVSTTIGIVLGNLAMIACLRRGGPRRTELLLSLKAPLVALMAYLWLGETLSPGDAFGAALALTGVCLAILFGGDKDNAHDTVSGPFLGVVGLGLLATACQGVGFLVMKPAMLDGTAPVAASALRLSGAAFLISVIALWPAQAFRSHAPMTPSLVGRTILPGMIGYGLCSTLLLYAFANMPAALAALLGSLSPILVLPILWWSTGRRPRAQAVLGALLAVSGTGVILLL